MNANNTINPTVDAYIAGVLDGSVVVGQWIRKAVQRHLKDLRRTDIYFDADAANYVIDFIEAFCIPSAQTEPIKLMAWQQFVIAISYGWKRLDGSRRFRRVYLEIAKKNGKTGLAAPLSIYHTIADGEISARVFVAATALKQARECFMEAVAMRDKHPELSAVLNRYGQSPVLSLYAPETNSRLSPMTRGSDSQDGAVVSAAVLDELHRWKSTDSLWSILRYGGDESIESLLPTDDRIVYHRCARMAVGALRNLGTSLSTGDVCVSIDEDDWSHPDRIATQVQRLIETGKAVTGFHSIFYYDTHTDRTFKYWYEPAGRNHPPYACGSSQMYTRAWWMKHKFPETGVEDYPFSRNALNHNQLDSIDAEYLFVARAHSDSTCYPKQLGVHRQFPAVPRAALPTEFFTAINPAPAKPSAKQKAKRNQKTSTSSTQE